jgi:ABC-type hemin transport system ATPase subunit
MAPAAHLARIRIAGFKSFADPVALDVLPGLTGLVGPNGCGKSNRDCREIGGHAAMAAGRCGSLAAWKRCPKPEPSVPL